MPRPQSYDHQQVISEAMHLFWRKGYAATSVKDLTDVTQLQPGSLYGAFKSKRKLFIESLGAYYSLLHNTIRGILYKNEDPLKRIRHFLEFVLKSTEENEQIKSCLLMNTLLEIPQDDTEIRQYVAGMFIQIENDIQDVLVEAQKSGSLASGVSPEASARLIMSEVFGIQVYKRINPDQQNLQQIINNLISPLEKT